MRKRTRFALGFGSLIALLLLFGVGVWFYLTQTESGRGRVRDFTVSQIADQMNAQVEIGEVRGSLLGGITLIDVSIRDLQGRPFLEADTISTRYSLRALLRGRIVLQDSRIVGAMVVLDKPPGEEWNFVRIFEPSDTTAPRSRSRWGRWVEIQSLSLADSRILIKSAWEPGSGLSTGEREEALRRALAGETRAQVIRVPGGYQNVMDFRELNAHLPYVMLAHPDSTALPIEVETLSTVALPYRPPPAIVKNLSGRFAFSRDSIFFRSINAEMSGSTIEGRGSYALGSGELRLQMRGSPLTLADMRWLYPALPEEAKGEMTLDLHRRLERTTLRASEMDFALGPSRLSGDLGLIIGDTLLIDDTHLRFQQIDTRLATELLPTLEVPRHGFVTGSLALEGDPASMQLDGDITFTEEESGTSRLIAQGTVHFAGAEGDGRSGEDFSFEDLTLQLRPLQMRHLADFAPSFPSLSALPSRGTLSGESRITGTLERFDIEGSLRLDDPRTGVSAARLSGGLSLGPEVRFRSFTVALDPLQLALVEEMGGESFISSSSSASPPLAGSLSGVASLNGTLARLDVSADLALREETTGTSRFGIRGALGLEPALHFHGLNLDLGGVPMALVSRFVPDAPARGTLFGNATLNGNLERLALASDLELQDPRTGRSAVAAEGVLILEPTLRMQDLSLIFQPLQMELLAEYEERLPARGTLEGNLTVSGTMQEADLSGDLTFRDPRTGINRLALDGGITLPVDDGGEASGALLRSLNLRFHPLQLSLLSELDPTLDLEGELTGTSLLNGRLNGLLSNESDLVLTSPGRGRSRVLASGAFGRGPAGDVRFQDLALSLRPLNVAWLSEVAPTLPLGGVLSGDVLLNGSTTSSVSAEGDLVHVEEGERSRVSGTAFVPLDNQGEVSVDLSLAPLSLATLGRFVPEAGLRGRASGRLQAAGDLGSVQLTTSLVLEDGGSFALSGWLDLEEPLVRYDVDGTFSETNLAAASSLFPSTSLSGVASLSGAGTDPATLDATLSADLRSLSSGQDIFADRITVNMRASSGLATFKDTRILLASARAEVEGSFGLISSRTGTLSYSLVVDSLSDFATWPPTISTARRERERRDRVRLQQVARLQRIELEREAQQRIEQGRGREGRGREEREEGEGRETQKRLGQEVLGAQRVVQAEVEELEVEIEAIGPELSNDTTTREAPLSPAAPTAQQQQRTSSFLAGSVRAEGIIVGNIAHFGTEGTLALQDFIYEGNTVRRGSATYSVQDIGTNEPTLNLDASLQQANIAGRALEEVEAEIAYQGERYGEGTASIFIQQDTATDIRADASFRLSLEENEILLPQSSLRFGSTEWNSVRPGAIRWSAGDVELETLEFASNEGGHLLLDGTLPSDASSSSAANLRIEASNLDLADLTTLLNQEHEFTGLLDLETDVRGTLSAPLLSGSVSLEQATVDGRDLPSTEATFEYSSELLTLDASMSAEEREIATATGSLPLNLSLRNRGGRPLLPDGPIDLQVRADSLPLAALSSFIPELQGASGWARGRWQVRGSTEAPQMEGDLELAMDSLYVAPLGLQYEDIRGAASFSGTSLVIDSLVARRGGLVEVAGSIDLASLTRPDLALSLRSENAWLLDDDDRGRIRGTLNLQVEGPLTEMRIIGTADITEGVIFVPEMGEIKTVVALDDPTLSDRVGEELLAEYEEFTRTPPFLQNLQAQVSVHVGRNVWVRSDEANVEVYTPDEIGPLEVRVDQRTGALAIEGTLNTDRGEYLFLTRRFTFTRGAATFSGEAEINPLIQVAAERSVQLPGREDLQIRIVLGGTLRDISIAMESDAQPPISQTDLLSFIAFGRGASSLFQQQGSALSGQGVESGDLIGNVAGLVQHQMAAVAIGSLATEFRSETAGSLGLDVFQLTPADVPAELFTGGFGDFLRGTKVEAGRYISPRLFLVLTSGLASGRPGLRMEYRTPGDFEWFLSWEPRYLPSDPTLSSVTPEQTNIFGTFLFRNWRF